MRIRESKQNAIVVLWSIWGLKQKDTWASWATPPFPFSTLIPLLRSLLQPTSVPCYAKSTRPVDECWETRQCHLSAGVFLECHCLFWSSALCLQHNHSDRMRQEELVLLSLIVTETISKKLYALPQHACIFSSWRLGYGWNVLISSPKVEAFWQS